MKSGTFTSRAAMGAGLSSLLLVVSGCGGGGSSPAPSPSPAPPTNNAPQFSSANSATVAENSTGGVLTLAASDADGDSITFSVSGGTDAGAFSLSNGELSFAAAPNFDLFSDQDRNNVFEIEVEARDSRGALARQSVSVTVLNEREGIAVTRILTGLGETVGMAATGETAQELVVGMSDGTYVRFEGSRSASDPGPNVQPVLLSGPVATSVRMLDISWGPRTSGFPGLIGMFANGQSVGLTRPVTNGVHQSATLAIGDGRDVPAEIFFDPNSGGYAAIGDPQGAFAQLGTPPGENGFGKLFQLTSGSGASTRSFDGREIGNGIQAPGGFAIINAQFALADQGSSVLHELNFLEINARPINFGWPFLEGNQILANGAPSPLIGPSLTYPVGDGQFEGRGIQLGASYSGPITGLDGQFIFGDLDGSIWSMPILNLTNGFLNSVETIELRNEDFRPDAGTIDSVVDIVADGAGTIYILDADGELFRVDQA